MTQIKTILTGIKTTGTPHLGNWAGAIKPAIDASRQNNVSCYYFLADYHALITTWDAPSLARSTLEIAAAWLALGLNPDQVVFYRQSDIREITELTWILSCLTAKGLMNRAHAYKAAVADNEAAEESDPDKGITMGLFNYPILMAADILMFKADLVPVGRDQIQHLEMTRDIAGRFNHHFGRHMTLPEPMIREQSSVIAGLDGRKMSKSYNNVIPVFSDSKKLRKLIFRIKTNSLPPEAPKNPDDCALFSIFRAFATDAETGKLRRAYQSGIGWGEVKQHLFEYLDALLDEPRKRYEEFIAHPADVESILEAGAEKARQFSQPYLEELRDAVGIRPLKQSR